MLRLMKEAICSLATCVSMGYATGTIAPNSGDICPLEIEQGERRISKRYSSIMNSAHMPNENDFESGIAAIKRIIGVNNLSRAVPNNLIELHGAFSALTLKIRADDKPDNIDMILLIDTNGKTQTASAVRFLANLENELIKYAKERNSDLKMKLACVFDSFVAAGSGVIPASIGALGGITQEAALHKIWNMPSKMLYPRSVGSCLSCCNGIYNTVKSIASAYFSTPVLVEKNTSDWNSLTYDAFDISKSGGKNLLEIFGSSSTHDLKSSLEVISLYDSDSIIKLVLETMEARDKDARARVKRMAIADAIEMAEGVLSVASEKSSGSSPEKIKKAIDGLEKINFVLKQSEKKYGSLSELKAALLNKTDIPRDILILNISADTFAGKVMVPSFSYDVKHTKNGKNIINLNYRFAIPSHFYQPKQNEAETFQLAVETGVNSIFPFKDARRTNISTATGMLIDFLNECNDKVIQAMHDTESDGY